MIPLTNISIFFVIKIATLILLGFYLIFAIIVVRQTKLMTDTLQLGFEIPVIIMSYVHLVFSILVFLSALLIL